jgi:hypothetical protein
VPIPSSTSTIMVPLPSSKWFVILSPCLIENLLSG